jgi:hypothetical protein
LHVVDRCHVGLSFDAVPIDPVQKKTLYQTQISHSNNFTFLASHVSSTMAVEERRLQSSRNGIAGFAAMSPVTPVVQCDPWKCVGWSIMSRKEST